jgi:hypothetical protein
MAAMLGCAPAGGASSRGQITLSQAYLALTHAGFTHLALYDNFERVAMNRYLFHPRNSYYMIALPVYRPRFGPISAIWYATTDGAKRLVASEVDFAKTPPPKSLPPDIVWRDIHEVRVCNVVLTTGHYPTVRERFERVVRMLRADC